MKVAIVGGGLVGRLAAWAVMQSGHTPFIFDRLQEAIVPRGFVFLHDPCGLPLRRQNIYVLETGGTAEDYALKVYGGRVRPDQVSFGKYTGVRAGYSPAELLAILNGLQYGMVKERSFSEWGEIVQLLDTYDRVVFTLPADRFLKGCWPSRQASVRFFKLHEGEDLQNFCVYSADPNIAWYRAGAMFGYAFYEYPVVVPESHVVVKVESDGAADPDQINDGGKILRTGRFGAWKKNMLSHDAYYEVLRWLG